jgi:hypothetical protein
MKFLIMRSCILFKIFPSNFPPSTMIANAVMFIHVVTFLVRYIYLNFILILNSKLKQNVGCIDSAIGVLVW